MQVYQPTSARLLLLLLKANVNSFQGTPSTTKVPRSHKALHPLPRSVWCTEAGLVSLGSLEERVEWSIRWCLFCKYFVLVSQNSSGRWGGYLLVESSNFTLFSIAFLFEGI